MRHSLFLFIFCMLLFSGTPQAYAATTKRIPQFSNTKVTVWETNIYPTNKESLQLHRHDQDRVIVALTNGKLKFVTNTGHTEILTFEKNKAYFFPKNPPRELQIETNIGKDVLKVMVIALN
jgi:hypothetical protein